MPNSDNPKSLVLVVGAGASSEVDLPVGAVLKDKIASALDFRTDRASFGGDDTIHRAFHSLAGDFSPHLRASKRIRDAMPQAPSIDNFIDAHRGDELIELVGKLAIGRCILLAEFGSKLYVDRGNVRNKINFKNIESTWFNGFFKLLVLGCQQSDLPERLAQVAIITFNYDRCIEHFLHESLQNYYGMDPQKATDILSHLMILHPYGSLGPLPWQDARGIPYGQDVDHMLLRSAADRLKTFTEGTDPSHSDIVEIRKLMLSADRVAFLGFAFNDQNMELLYGTDAPQQNQRMVFGTALDISWHDKGMIEKQLAARGGHPQDQIELLDGRCAELFTKYSRSLAFR